MLRLGRTVKPRVVVSTTALAPAADAAVRVEIARDMMNGPQTVRERLARGGPRVPLTRRRSSGAAPGTGSKWNSAAVGAVETAAPAREFNRIATVLAESRGGYNNTRPVATPWSRQYADAMAQSAAESGTMQGTPTAPAAAVADASAIADLRSELVASRTLASTDDEKDKLDQQLELLTGLARIAKVKPLSPEQEQLVREIAAGRQTAAVAAARAAEEDLVQRSVGVRADVEDLQKLRDEERDARQAARAADAKAKLAEEEAVATGLDAAAALPKLQIEIDLATQRVNELENKEIPAATIDLARAEADFRSAETALTKLKARKKSRSKKAAADLAKEKVAAAADLERARQNVDGIAQRLEALNDERGARKGEAAAAAAEQDALNEQARAAAAAAKKAEKELRGAQADESVAELDVQSFRPRAPAPALPLTRSQMRRQAKAMAAARETARALAPDLRQIERAVTRSMTAAAPSGSPLTDGEKIALLREEAKALGLTVSTNAKRKVILNQIAAVNPGRAARLSYLAF